MDVTKRDVDHSMGYNIKDVDTRELDRTHSFVVNIICYINLLCT